MPGRAGIDRISAVVYDTPAAIVVWDYDWDDGRLLTGAHANGTLIVYPLTSDWSAIRGQVAAFVQVVTDAPADEAQREAEAWFSASGEPLLRSAYGTDPARHVPLGRSVDLGKFPSFAGARHVPGPGPESFYDSRWTLGNWTLAWEIPHVRVLEGFSIDALGVATYHRQVASPVGEQQLRGTLADALSALGLPGPPLTASYQSSCVTHW